MEGRDIGTVVVPATPFKFYLDADPAVRAERRHAELAGKGATTDPAEVARQLAERDARDSSRTRISPPCRAGCLPHQHRRPPARGSRGRHGGRDPAALGPPLNLWLPPGAGDRFSRQAFEHGAIPVARAQRLDVGDPRLGHAIGGDGRRDALAPGDREDPQDVVEDGARPAQGALLVVADELLEDVDQSAGVDHEIGRVEDPPGVDLGAVPGGIGELVVGAAGDRLGFEPGKGLVVEDRAQRAGSEDVALDVVNRLRRDDLDAESLRLGDRVTIDVAADDARALVLEVPGEIAADAAEALDRHGARTELGRSPDGLSRRLDALQYTQRGNRRRVAAAAELRSDAGHPCRLLRDELHVGGVGADVLGGYVVSAQRVDEAPEGAKESLRLVLLGVAEDDRFRPAEVDSCGGGLVGHAARQPERVGHARRRSSRKATSASRRDQGRGRSSGWR